jgi:hypothetical protein
MKEQAKDKFRIQTLPEPPQGQHAQFPPFRPPVPGLPPAFGMQRIRRCLNQVTEIILRGGERIWFYPTALRGRTLVGNSRFSGSVPSIVFKNGLQQAIF